MPRRFTVALEDTLAVRMDTLLLKTGQSRSAYVAGLVAAHLSDGELGKGKKDRGRELIKRDATQQQLDKLLDEALVRKFEDDPDGFLAGLDDKTFATLVASRAPKPRGGDEDLEASYLSLSRSLERMPDAADLSRELGKVKNRVKKLEVELALQSGVAKSLRGFVRKYAFGDVGAKVLTAAGAGAVIERAAVGGDDVLVSSDSVWDELVCLVRGLESALYDYCRDCAGRGVGVERLRALCVYFRRGGAGECGGGGGGDAPVVDHADTDDDAEDEGKGE